MSYIKLNSENLDEIREKVREVFLKQDRSINEIKDRVEVRQARQHRSRKLFAVDSGVYQGHRVLVWRFADYLDTPERRINFHIALFREEEDEGWVVEVNSTPQRPIFQADLDRWLLAAGLTDITYYGDLTGAPFVPDASPDLVAVARRPA